MPTTIYEFNGNDLDGFRVWNANLAHNNPAAFSTNGLSDGVLNISYADNGSNSFIVTPVSFSGDQSDLLGGTLDMEYFNSIVNTPTTIEIRLVANDGTTLSSNVTLQSGVEEFPEVDLVGATFGVTDAQLQTVLSDLAFYGFDANIVGANESVILSTVSFTAPPCARRC